MRSVSQARSWGATAAVVATNGRKLLSVVLSFVLFPKPFGVGFLLSGLSIVGGVYVHQRSKHSKTRPPSPTNEAVEVPHTPLPVARRGTAKLA